MSNLAQWANKTDNVAKLSETMEEITVGTGPGPERVGIASSIFAFGARGMILFCNDDIQRGIVQ